MNSLAQFVTQGFTDFSGRQPQVTVLAPGRINIIGEHIDYNDGFVLPAAIDRFTCFCISKVDGKEAVFKALDLADTIQVDVSKPLVPSEKTWANYLLGVVERFAQMGKEIGGFEVAFAGNIPAGAGMSSSAALECGFGFALDELFELGLSDEEIALAGQWAEHNFVGVKCGIMDQFASVFGRKDQVILLDCLTLERRYIDADFGDYSLVLLNSNVSHQLQDSQYNHRREEASKALEAVTARFPEVQNYRGVRREHLDAVRNSVGNTSFDRGVFVIEEIARVHNAVEALENGNIEALGRLLNKSHDGLSKLYQVSCPELDFLAGAAAQDKAVAGSRMMGGGFGGCTINLVKKGTEEVFITDMAEAYATAFGLELTPYRLSLSDGVHSLTNVERP